MTSVDRAYIHVGEFNLIIAFLPVYLQEGPLYLLRFKPCYVTKYFAQILNNLSTIYQYQSFITILNVLPRSLSWIRKWSRKFLSAVTIFYLVTVTVFVWECKFWCLLYDNHIVHSFVYSYSKSPPLACCCNNWNMATWLCLFSDHGHILHGTVRWRLTPCCNHDKGLNVRCIQFPGSGIPVPSLEVVFTNLIPIQQFSHIKFGSDWLWIDGLWSCNQKHQ